MTRLFHVMMRETSDNRNAPVAPIAAGFEGFPHHDALADTAAEAADNRPAARGGGSRTVATMTITVLHIDACPNWREASARVRTTLQSLGRDEVEVVEVLLESPEQASVVPFAGSPTILVDGDDLFPSDGGTNDLACRVYLTETGFAGQPSLTQLERALRERLANRSSTGQCASTTSRSCW